MTTCPSQLAYRSLRAPPADRSALVDPPFEEVGALVGENVHLREGRDYDFQGRCLVQLARQARKELLHEAWRWTTAYRNVEPFSADAADLIFLAGHQPQLFHPGVWLKNFALGNLAGQHGAVAVNLLIDSDTVKSTALRVPGGPVTDPEVEAIPFDRSGQDRMARGIPYEQRRIVDAELFSSFGCRVAERISSLVPDPLIDQYWPLAQRRMRQTDNLGACLAQSRHQLEGDWGLQTLEVPQSRVCGSEPFCWFVAHLLARLPRLWEVYNEAVGEYRRVNRIRSTAHPVPDLSADDRWLEAPLWIFSADDPRRRPLFACQRGDRVVLSDRHRLQIELPLSLDGDGAAAVERLMDLDRQNVKIRSRALITTLWARLIVGDLFLHGIGGAKYDRVTDLLIERFFGLRPPGFMVLSATLHLPIERRRVTVERSRAIQQQLRNLAYHPERYIDGVKGGPLGVTKDPTELIATKARWIRTPQTRRNARARCRAIRRVNEALQPWVQAERRRLLRLTAQTARALQAESVLAWRQYGFCLYPEKTFREFLLGLLPKSA